MINFYVHTYKLIHTHCVPLPHPDLSYGGKDYYQLGAVPHTGDCGRHG